MREANQNKIHKAITRPIEGSEGFKWHRLCDNDISSTYGVGLTWTDSEVTCEECLKVMELSNIATPRHETVEQWEERTGEKYPSDAPVWVYSFCAEEWQLYTLEELKGTKCEIMYVANHHGKPTKDLPLD